MNAIQTAFSWLQDCLKWFFPSAFLADPFISTIVNFFLLAWGLWLLSALILKPLVELLKGIRGFMFK